MKPLLIVEIKNDYEFQKYENKQNFICKFILIKQIKIKKNNEKIKSFDFGVKEDDFVVDDTWNRNGVLPKIFLFGTLFNSN